MKKTIIALAAVSCMLTACAVSDAPRHPIEKHLGVSLQGKRILDEHMFGLTEGVPDMMLVRHELLKHDDMRNLTVGLLMIPWTDELDDETIKTDIYPDDLKQVLDANLSRRGSTLVRPEDVTNLTTQTDAKGRIVGTFDWVLPNLFRGRARFVARGDKIEYLGILRKNPVGIYDCETIFSPYGDMLASQQWVQTEYFVVIKPVSQRTKELSRSASQKEMISLLTTANLNSSMRFARFQDDDMPMVCIAMRETRDDVISILSKSDEWRTGLSGRAVGTLLGPSIDESVEEQIRKMANTNLEPISGS
jgi:hypothetical protein